MATSSVALLNLPGELDVLRRALDLLDVGVVVLSADLRRTLYANAAATQIVGRAESLPPLLDQAIADYVSARRETTRPPPAIRIELRPERGVYVRVLASDGDAPLEVAFLREEVLRDPDLFKMLNGRYGVTRREFQILASLRLGKTNRQIATELGLAEGSVAGHLHRLFERFGVPNRTRLVQMVEAMGKRS
jgi:DNA-binding CsgD family transcriptional regulator